MQDEEWSGQTGTTLYRKILERRIDEIYQELVGTVSEINSIEAIAIYTMKAVAKIEGLTQAIDESRYESDGRESSGEIPDDG